VTASEITIRPASAADLARIWDIRFRNDIRGEANPPEQGPIPPYLGHLLETADVRVAERGGSTIGYVAITERSGFFYLNDLFVDPESQSASAGKTLLRAVLPATDRPLCVMASSDHRAVALYTRFGMTPRWPSIDLEAASAELRFPAASDVELVEAEFGDPLLIDWDAEASGRRRDIDLRFWCEREGGRAFWCLKDGMVAGYGVVRFEAGRNWHPEAVLVGPIGVKDRADAASCLVAIAERASKDAPFVELIVVGPHPGLAPLLGAGFRIAYIGTYGANEHAVIDPARYVCSGGDLL